MLVQRLDERARLHLIAQAGIEKSISQLNKEPPKSYDALKDTWSSDSGSFKDIPVGLATFNISYDYIDEPEGLPGIRYGLVDEERKININKVDITVLKRLLQITLGLNEAEAEDLAASIVDWRDSDSQTSAPSGGAEDSYYHSLQYPYEAKDGEFEILDELLLVKGMDEKIFEKIKNYLTIYGDGKVNVNTAPRAVLLALGLSENITDKIILFRQGEDRISATADDNVFDGPSTIVARLSQMFHLSDSEIAHISTIVDQYLVTNANNFMIKTTAKLTNRKNTSQIICVVNRNGRVLYWQESG